MTRTRRFFAIAVAAATLVGFAATPALAKRDEPPTPPPSSNFWEWSGGTTNIASSDGPKSSNSYNLAEGAFVYRSGYWDVPLTTYQAGFTYKSGGGVGGNDGSPRISISLALPVAAGDQYGVETDNWVYLDPDYCPSAFNAAGWATSNFFRSGSSCTIFASWSTVGYTGHDAVPFVSAATSAWNEMAANTPNGETLASWGFLINDLP
jgi:hypothetical protein